MTWKKDLKWRNDLWVFVATFLNCGIIIGFSDTINHEGPRKITDRLLTMLKLGVKLPSLPVYGAACQL
jgi:hypothetical protein